MIKHVYSLNESHERINRKSKKYSITLCKPVTLVILLLIVVATLSLLIVGIGNHQDSFVTASSDSNTNIRKGGNNEVEVVPKRIPALSDSTAASTSSTTSTPIETIVSTLQVQLKKYDNIITSVVTMQPLKTLYPSMNIQLNVTGETDMHFIHVPKCGGTSMTSVLRKIACEIDRSRNHDCCTNPGFCDWHAHRRCLSIKGCTNHFPQRSFIYKPYPSITLLRDPVSRSLSAFFYHGHSPNNDYFQVRPYFKDIREGKLPKVQYPEYIEMTEYTNIMTRMFGADSFPYKNITITQSIFDKAIDALDNIYFIGVQEVYDISIELLLLELNMSHLNIVAEKERDQSVSKSVKRDKSSILSDKQLMMKAKEMNSYDVDLYQVGLLKFCLTCMKYPLLVDKLKKQSDICNKYIQ